jgi:hypothetical protein
LGKRKRGEKGRKRGVSGDKEGRKEGTKQGRKEARNEGGTVGRKNQIVESEEVRARHQPMIERQGGRQIKDTKCRNGRDGDSRKGRNRGGSKTKITGGG